MRRARTGILELSVNARDVCLGRAGLKKRLLKYPPSVYQEYLAKTLTDKYGNLSVQMDKIINDANAEIEMLHQKLAGTTQIGIFMNRC